jgi:hypothetical protein
MFGVELLEGKAVEACNKFLWRKLCRFNYFSIYMTQISFCREAKLVLWGKSSMVSIKSFFDCRTSLIKNFLGGRLNRVLIEQA